MEATTRVYVVGVPTYIKKKFFLDLFANEGIRDAIVVRSKRMTQPNSAFLTFDTSEQAAEVLRKGKLKTGNRTMKLLPSHKWHELKVMHLQPGPSTPGPSHRPPTREPSEHQLEHQRSNALRQPSQLVTECLILLASSLPFHYRAKMEQVSKAWQEASLLSHQGTTTMSTTDWRWIKEDESWMEDIDLKVSLDCFNWGIKRFGKYLKNLTFHKGSTLPSTAVTLAAKACKGLEQLDLTHIQIREAALRELGLTQTNLKTLSIGICEGPVDPELAGLLQSNSNMTELNLIGNDATGKSLILGTHIKRLSLVRCKHLNSGAVITAVTYFENLTSLILTECPTLFHNDLRSAIIENKHLRSCLKYLTIRSGGIENPSTEEPRSPRPVQEGDWIGLNEELVVAEEDNFGQAIESVEHLETIRCAWVQEHLLINIADHVKHLTYLDISLCTNLRGQFALECLGTLIDLECLKMNGMHPTVGGLFLKSLINIGHMESRDNGGITDEDICGLLNSAIELTHLDLEGTFNITREVVIKANDLLRTRPRNKKLTIKLGNTQARPVRRDRRNFYLEIDYIRKSEPLVQYVDM